MYDEGHAMAIEDCNRKDGWINCLRAEVNRLGVERNALRAEVERLRVELAAAKELTGRALDKQAEYLRQAQDLLSRAQSAEANVERLREALKAMQEVDCECDQCMASYAILSETPAKSLAKVKAAAVREAADKIKHDDGVIGQCSAYMALTLMADELEAQ